MCAECRFKDRFLGYDVFMHAISAVCRLRKCDCKLPLFKIFCPFQVRLRGAVQHARVCVQAHACRSTWGLHACNSFCRFLQLISHLECYARAAPQMRRACGVTRCGPYRELELSAPGIAHRCATLQCDLHCIEALLRKQAQCRDAGTPALHYLRKHSQIQASLRSGTGSRPPGHPWTKALSSVPVFRIGMNKDQKCDATKNSNFWQN